SVSLGMPARASGSHTNVEPEAPAAVHCQRQWNQKLENAKQVRILPPPTKIRKSYPFLQVQTTKQGAEAPCLMPRAFGNLFG
ncbi:MAG: hypothetical protein VKL39_00005, partial [Leptolyngbyaceae bacterium]|nr:hypothetical protein [Leptolyngbyaceae bacterium]